MIGARPSMFSFLKYRNKSSSSYFFRNIRFCFDITAKILFHQKTAHARKYFAPPPVTNENFDNQIHYNNTSIYDEQMMHKYIIARLYCSDNLFEIIERTNEVDSITRSLDHASEVCRWIVEKWGKELLGFFAESHMRDGNEL